MAKFRLYLFSEEKVPKTCESTYTGQSTPGSARYIQENEGTTGGYQRAANDKQNNPRTYQKNLFHWFSRIILHSVKQFCAMLRA
jgi:hypothetical protein